MHSSFLPVIGSRHHCAPRYRSFGLATAGAIVGFTLIEMMIVLAVIGLLAAIAIPRYQNYVNRARVSEGLVLAQPLKHAVVEYHSVHGHLPPGDNWLGVLGALGVDASSAYGAAEGRYVKRLWWYNNTAEPAIKIRYRGGVLDDRLLFIKADFGGANVHWRCVAPGSDGVPDEFLPPRCR